MKYYLIITYTSSTAQILMNTGTRAVAASEENKELLLVMGKRLLDENIISSYQLVQTAGPEVFQWNCE